MEGTITITAHDGTLSTGVHMQKVGNVDKLLLLNCLYNGLNLTDKDVEMFAIARMVGLFDKIDEGAIHVDAAAIRKAVENLGRNHNEG